MHRLFTINVLYQVADSHSKAYSQLHFLIMFYLQFLISCLFTINCFGSKFFAKVVFISDTANIFRLVLNMFYALELKCFLYS
ncbi:uncharacterized protein BX663DRAFT_512966 [Cokeromyces recurvatus]|uniref:uncharacterized protein n=1 Tax=Cokeromyces recurvatus TaxID=90255 RepID=UPI0022206DE3|nr:uncharacterized protein BX663DRAFT_512966 [Cokeromyces recurvatus]KAI7901936.1 hypothetical protein BX663DRAFT_512966 [Cokeromyces recurvatus]